MFSILLDQIKFFFIVLFKLDTKNVKKKKLYSILLFKMVCRLIFCFSKSLIQVRHKKYKKQLIYHSLIQDDVHTL